MASNGHFCINEPFILKYFYYKCDLLDKFMTRLKLFLIFIIRNFSHFMGYVALISNVIG